MNSALRRARKAADERLPEQSQQATLRALGDEGLRTVVERYMDALERADVDAIVALLTEDATWSMPPFARWYRGRESIAASWWMGRSASSGGTFQPARTGSRPSAVTCGTRRGGAYVDVLTLRGTRISEVTGFVDREVFARFALPNQLPVQRALSSAASPGLQSKQLD